MNDAQMAGTGAVGFCDPEIQTIGLVGSQPNDSMQDTFLHGLEQQPCHVMGLRETEKEENFVRRLVTGLCTVWNHNPAVLKCWITQSLYSTAAIVVISMCFICLQLSILHSSRWFDWLSLVNDLPLTKREKERPGT
jgi:hypothetical protein